MPRVGKQDGRNFGYGRQLSHAGPQALRELFGAGRYATVKTHAERWQMFAQWCRSPAGPGINDARLIDRPLLDNYAQYLREQVDQGKLSIATAQNRLSTVNRTLEALRGDRQVCVPSPSQALNLYRQSVRQSAPPGQQRTQVEGLVDALKQQRLERVAAIVRLARETGMRLRETILADLPRLQREATNLGRINIQDGTKGGRRGATVPRWVEVTPGVRDALRQAAAVSPKGSRNLLAPEQSYIQFLEQQIRPARAVLHTHGLKGFHDLRAAYACERYQQLTGHPAPVNGGHCPDRTLDRSAREQISQELGHNRIEVAAAYIGSLGRQGAKA
jgi:integrase